MGVLGFFLAFGTAISEALKDIFSKANLLHVDEYTAAFSMHLVISVLLAPIVVTMGVQEVSTRFLIALLSASFIQLAVILLYMKAIKRAELSATVPLVTLTPLFMLLSSPLLIGEFPSVVGIGGIFLIVAGTYLLNMERNKKGFLAPFKTLVYSQSSRYMLIVAFLWSITANIDKIGVEETSPIFWAFSKDLLILSYLVPIVYFKSKAPLQQLRQRWLSLLGIGIFRTTSVITQMFAIQYILVAYVISIKRSSALLIILYAFFFLQERKNFKTRLMAVVIISLGLLLIALS